MASLAARGIACLFVLTGALLADASGCGPTPINANVAIDETMSNFNCIQPTRHQQSCSASNHTSNGQVFATAVCPAGEILASGGYDIVLDTLSEDDPNPSPPFPVWDIVTASFPSDPSGAVSSTPTAWTVFALASPTFSVGNIPAEYLMAKAYCLKPNFTPVPTVSTTSVVSPTTSSNNTVSATAGCQNSGEVLSGGGFQFDPQQAAKFFLDWQNPNGSDGSVYINESFPTSVGKSLGWRASYFIPSNFVLASGQFPSLTAFAVCLNSLHITAGLGDTQALSFTPTECVSCEYPSAFNTFPIDPATGRFCPGKNLGGCEFTSDTAGTVGCSNGFVTSGGFTGMSGNFYTNTNQNGNPNEFLGPNGVLVQNNDLNIQSNGVVGGSKWRLEVVSAVTMIVSNKSAPAVPDLPLPVGSISVVTDCINVT